MAGKTLTSMINIAFKKLVGKANTSVVKADYEEDIASNVQLGNSTIFASTIPTPPSTAPAAFTLLDKDGNVTTNAADAVVEYLEFSCSEVPGTTYDANSINLSGDSDEHGSTSANVSRPHTYALSLPDNYTTGGSTKNLSIIGTVGIGGITGSNQVQVVPNSFGLDYTIELYENSDFDDAAKIPLADEIDWILDPFNGTIFVQDGASGFKEPKNARAYLYVGNYQKDIDMTDKDSTGELAKQKLFNAYTFNQECTFITGSGSSFQGNDLGSDKATYFFLNDNIHIGSEQVFANGLLQQTSSRGIGESTGQINDYLAYPSSSNETFLHGVSVPANSTIFEFTYPVSSSRIDGKVLVTYLAKDS